MNDLLRGFPGPRENPVIAPVVAQGPGPEKVIPAVIPADFPPTAKSAAKSAEPKQRTAKQLENDERLRARAKAKKDAGLKPFEKAPARVASDKAAPAPAPEPKPVPPPATAESLGLAPDEVVKVRQKTIEDLQSAYANGFQKEVFELLSRFGNGAKSFRELPPESFVPIREAIDNGALT
jgi:hypothetical protein